MLTLTEHLKLIQQTYCDQCGQANLYPKNWELLYFKQVQLTSTVTVKSLRVLFPAACGVE